MGIWGVGNFESDNAKDVLARWIQRIIDEIQATFLIEDELELYQIGDGQIVANVDILETLHKHYQKYPDLAIETVQDWKDRYLKLLDKLSNEWSGDESDDKFFTERKRIIQETFERLERTLQEIIDFYDNE
jgi:uncharacterized protein YukE